MKHILFVDDETMVLNGLRRMLHPMRHEWEMVFVESGLDALEWLDNNPCDVIVSDIRMPGMNGVQLLEEVRRRHPRVIRFVLSGHSEMSILLGSVRTTHQFLAKPCDAETLKSAIERALALRDLLENGQLSTLISRLESLPSLPSLYMEIINEISSPDGSLLKVGEIIAKDVGMTAKILQIVNSAFFGLQRHVSSPSQAVSLLGFDIIRSLVLTAKIFSGASKQEGGLDLDTLWQHSEQVGVLARQIAVMQEADIMTCDYALMAGMLHDVGKLVLATQLPKDYAKVPVLTGGGDIAGWVAEREVFGCTHMEIGAYLLGIWGFPNAIVEALAYHDNPNMSVGDGFSPLTAVHVANALIRAEEMGCKFTELLDMDYLERLNLVEQISAWQELYVQLQQNDESEP